MRHPHDQSWASSPGDDQGHMCNCVGCCRVCGSCVTNPAHTQAMCDLIAKQRKEIVALAEVERRLEHSVPVIQDGIYHDQPKDQEHEWRYDVKTKTWVPK